MKKEPAIIIDMDGTIADISIRMDAAAKVYKEGSNNYWEEVMRSDLVHLDVPIQGALDYLKQETRKILYVSARRESTAWETIMWLSHNFFPQGEVYLRPIGERGLDWKIDKFKYLKRRWDVELSIGDMDTDGEASAANDITFMKVRTNRWVDVCKGCGGHGLPEGLNTELWCLDCWGG